MFGYTLVVVVWALKTHVKHAVCGGGGVVVGRGTAMFVVPW